MPTIDVVDAQRKKVRSVDLKREVFGVEGNVPLVHEAVVMQRASQRQGTASSLRRGEVSGSGKKPWRQKHTGRARAGSVRSPLWRHGGSAFGPKPRTYAFRLPKQKYRAALQSALSSKVTAGALTVVTDLVLPQAKTGLLKKALVQLGLTKKTLLVVDEHRAEVSRAARNLASVKVVRPQELNVYDVVRYDSILIPERELARVQDIWS